MASSPRVAANLVARASLDRAPQHSAGGALLIHYGSPVVTSHNTVVVPVKTGVGGGFRFEARSGTNGDLIVMTTIEVPSQITEEERRLTSRRTKAALAYRCRTAMAGAAAIRVAQSS